MAFNEDSRVKIPAILHLTRLGYQYLSLKGAAWNADANIFPSIFKESIFRINEDLEEKEAERLLDEVSLLLDYEDLGKAFYERLVSNSGLKLIDFEDFDKNQFHVVTELPCINGEEEFRPDVTLLINGMPLVFIEVKKPNNLNGVIAERDRINTRSQNKKFRRFINATQFMIFSNNMEYDNEAIHPLQGAFYATSSYSEANFNYFREEEDFDLGQLLSDPDDALENIILRDNNLAVIKHNPEFLTNKEPESPTNRILTSLLCRERLAFVLKYAIAYVKDTNGVEKHIMRYPQVFATRAISRKLNEGVRKGIIWHTQGSGKTALAFYSVHYLTDYFQKRGIIPKFYFIVDRLDLLKQASKEFASRDLIVHAVNSRQDFIKDIKQTTAIQNRSGRREITVVNIQKFTEDSNVVSQADYDINIQRVYFLDEVHRSYNPKGSFLANLTESDKNAIKVGLTGTPLLGNDYNSRALFGDYIHKYYYNMSIADGYTLRLIREEIDTQYKLLLDAALKQVEVMKGQIKKMDVYAHPKFVEPMLDYIISDFEKSRATFGDSSIGGMVVCDSADQAKEMFRIFVDKYVPQVQEYEEFAMVAEPEPVYGNNNKKNYKVRSAILILHDVGDKEYREEAVLDFKAGKIDFLFVYNMLLTGFDAKRLKKIYLGRVVKQHNLLQTLTRVNRTYKNFRYGYVVDFADIRSEFDATNKAYFDELQSELGDEMEHYSNLFKSREEVMAEIADIREVLFQFDTQNAEIFSRQVSQIQDRRLLITLKKALENARSLYNLLRLFGQYDLLDKLDFHKMNQLHSEVVRHLALITQREALESSTDNGNLLNIALEDVLFLFRKISEEELVLADELKNTLRKTREALASNFDQKDPDFISLREELERLFKKKNLSEITQEDMRMNIGSLRKIHERAVELNRENDRLRTKYAHDPKYARIHKRLTERGTISQKQLQLFDALTGVKQDADMHVLQNTRLLDNEEYFNRMTMPYVIQRFKDGAGIPLDVNAAKYVNGLITKEYTDEFYGRAI